jgi:coenzyme Q-binding protein COQ10
MATFFEQVELPYSRQQVFDLVADIESYPRFLPHLAFARIKRRKGDILWVDQQVRFKLIRLNFSTRAVLDPPSSIHVSCSDSPFGTFSDEWTFLETSSGGTRLQCHSQFEFNSGLLRSVLGLALGEILRTTVRAFERRARHLFGPAPLHRPEA